MKNHLASQPVTTHALQCCRVVCAIIAVCFAAAMPSPAQTLTTLADFNQTNGAFPVAKLTQGIDGNVYGTTLAGGNAASLGTVFKLTNGTLTTIYVFCSLVDCGDGEYSYSALVQNQSGNFYGTTEGGAYGQTFGTIFTITPAGGLTTLHVFSGTDGQHPKAGLTFGTDGDLYGTTSQGGTSDAGTVFKITPSGTFTTLHNFDYSDGNNPASALIQAMNGDFYGTTLFSGGNGGGTIFKITPVGALTTLYNFCSQPNCADGEFPNGTLIQAAGGNLWGTTSGGGTIAGCNNANCGTIYKISAAGAFTQIYNFCAQSNCADGGQPVAGLVQGTDGNFYGATTYGGANNEGTIFKIKGTGKFTLLHTFDGTDGASPNGGLMQSTDGNFYGTTPTAGPGGYGTVFSLNEDLGPFVEINPASGRVGAPVIILGNNLTVATQVSFDGTPAAFTVVSSTEIQTTVPAGAKTGVVEVTMPTTTLKSNVVFRVP
jgi:uncharacterized repeat protein (TIGR03803 family)